MITSFAVDSGKGNKSANRKNDKTTRVWNDELESAFVEALRAYPPTKQRLKYYQHPSGQYLAHGLAGYPTKLFSRAQLIQAYIHSKTGQTRTKKQIASHLQRMKKLNSENPEALALLQVPGEDHATTEQHSTTIYNIALPMNSIPVPSFDLKNFSSDAQQTPALHFTTFLQPRYVPTSNDVTALHHTNKSNLDTTLNARVGSVIDNTVHRSASSTSSSSPLSIAQRRLGTDSTTLPNMQPFSLAFPVHHQALKFQSPSSFGMNSASAHQCTCTHAPAMSHDVPSTPLAQMMHTPLEPPEVQRNDRWFATEDRNLSLTRSPCDHIMETYHSPVEINQRAMPFYRISSDTSTLIRSVPSSMYSQSGPSTSSPLHLNGSISPIKSEWHSSSIAPGLDIRSLMLPVEMSPLDASVCPDDATVKLEL